jgi:hypothetical protein
MDTITILAVSLIEDFDLPPSVSSTQTKVDSSPGLVPGLFLGYNSRLY